ncbi:MAG: signal recognition particle receptor subunit alpha, partial [Gammaproteobacteria bacterium]|nr:signal recognition particle receptor subunit alpha [Gammaproteobacteria bacterium]
MFENLTDRLSKTLQDLRGRGRLTEDNIRDSLREVRMALLEADVALPVVKEFIEAVRVKALGQDVIASISPGQVLIKVVNDELVSIMGESQSVIDLNHKPPVVVLMAGLQGAGKTTTAAKLARRLREVEKKSVMVASADVYRPAAIEQLKTLAAEVDVEFHPSSSAQKPVAIAQEA